jgi:hypothetical protein
MASPSPTSTSPLLTLPKDDDSRGVETRIAGGADDIEGGGIATTSQDHQTTIQMHGYNLIASHLHNLVVYALNILPAIKCAAGPSYSPAIRTVPPVCHCAATAAAALLRPLLCLHSHPHHTQPSVLRVSLLGSTLSVLVSTLSALARARALASYAADVCLHCATLTFLLPSGIGFACFRSPLSTLFSAVSLSRSRVALHLLPLGRMLACQYNTYEQRHVRKSRATLFEQEPNGVPRGSSSRVPTIFVGGGVRLRRWNHGFAARRRERLACTCCTSGAVAPCSLAAAAAAAGATTATTTAYAKVVAVVAKAEPSRTRQRRRRRGWLVLGWRGQEPQALGVLVQRRRRKRRRECSFERPFRTVAVVSVAAATTVAVNTTPPTGLALVAAVDHHRSERGRTIEKDPSQQHCRRRRRQRR